MYAVTKQRFIPGVRREVEIHLFGNVLTACVLPTPDLSSVSGN